MNGTEYGLGGVSAPVGEHVPGKSSGLADIVIGAKGLVLDRKAVRLTGAVDLHVPSGDELNFLGSGTIVLWPTWRFPVVPGVGNILCVQPVTGSLTPST